MHDFGVLILDVASPFLRRSEQGCWIQRAKPKGRLWAEPTAITHSHPVCRDANRLWALSIAKTIREGLSSEEVDEYVVEIAPRITKDQILIDTIKKAKSFEEGVVAITMRRRDLTPMQPSTAPWRALWRGLGQTLRWDDALGRLNTSRISWKRRSFTACSPLAKGLLAYMWYFSLQGRICWILLALGEWNGVASIMSWEPAL